MLGKVIGVGGDEVSIVSYVSSRGLGSVLSTSYFLSVGYSYKPSLYYLSLSLSLFISLSPSPLFFLKYSLLQRATRYIYIYIYRERERERE